MNKVKYISFIIINFKYKAFAMSWIEVVVTARNTKFKDFATMTHKTISVTIAHVLIVMCYEYYARKALNFLNHV